MFKEYFIYGIRKDDNDISDLDAAIDRYFFYECDNMGNYYGKFNSSRQYLVDKVKEGDLAYTFPNEHIGARCEVKISPNGIEYLKSIPDGNPENNISSLPGM